MNKDNLKRMRQCFDITETEVNEIVSNKDHQSRFILYMAALDHDYSNLYTFQQLGYNLHTPVDKIRGYTSPYQVLLNENFDRDTKQLFHFIVNRMCLDIVGKVDLL